MNLPRDISRIAVGLMLVMLGWQLMTYFGIGMHALLWPFELDYGEGIVWQQANMMLTPEAYGRIDGFPAIVFHYPPLYHMWVRVVSMLFGVNMLFAGRAVSIGATLFTVVMIGMIVARTTPANVPRGGRILAAVSGALCALCFVPVVYWSLLMRVDMAAFLLSVAGFWLGLKAFENPRLIYLSALCFVGAVYVKQTSLAAPLALFSLMVWLRPKLALSGVVTCIVAGLIVLAGLAYVTNGGFIRHVFLYNINRFELSRLQIILQVVQAHGLIFCAAFAAIYLRASDLRRRYAGLKWSMLVNSPADVAWTGVIFYFASTSLILVTVAKSGSSANYLIEWMLVISMLIGCGLADVCRAATHENGADGRAEIALIAIVVPLFIAIQARTLDAEELGFNDLWSAKRSAQMAQLSARVRAAPKQIISDDMVMLLLSGKPVVWEPSIFAELASMGAWNEQPFADKIRAQEFSMFITAGKRGDALFDSRYNPAIADAIDAAYPVQERLAGYILHLPAKK